MEITTTCRRYKLSPDLKEHAEKRIAKLSRYHDSIREANLVLAQEKYRQIAELTVHASGMDLMSREENPEMLTSIDRVVDRMERQIKKHTARIKQRKTLRPVPAGVVIEESELGEVEPEEEFSPVVVRTSQVEMAPMTVEEAIHFLREKDWDFVLFPNARSGRMAVVYHRDDGNYGLVETPERSNV
jgi:putative sigma-54 modulation protein